MTEINFVKPVSLNGLWVLPFASVEQIVNYAEQNKGILVAINAEKVRHATDDLRSLTDNNIGYCDGSGVAIALHQKGYNEAIKIAGCDLWLELVERFQSTKSFYLVGGKQEVIEETVRKLQLQFPEIKILGYHHGYLKSKEEQSALINEVARLKPDVVFVAMGSPKQELLMRELQKRHPFAIYQGLGGSYDIYVGHVERAPKWWIDHNMEFAYRLIKQPSRIKRQISLLKYAWWLMTKKL